MDLLSKILVLNISDKIIVFIFILMLIAAVTVAIILIIKQLHGLKFKNKSVDIQIGDEPDNNQKSTVNTLEVRDYRNHLEIRDYRNQIIQVFDGPIKDEIRQQIRENGWMTIKDWDEYEERSINLYNLKHTTWLDEHYYYNSIIGRLELFEWNKIIWRDVEGTYQAMFEKMLEIMKDGYKNIERKKQELQEIMDNRECKGSKSKCPKVADIIRLTTEININEYVSIREKCMVEAERAISEIVQLYYTHYVALYKQKKGANE